MDEPYDLICVGFGPAALAIAVALHDKAISARVLFLERQQSFAWHAGMLLPNARMQISFLKDLATQRDPTSYFTFLSYLHSQGRLAAFTNLGTFLPLREEFNDYLSWAAGHFKDQVRYGTEVGSIEPLQRKSGRAVAWTVTGRDVETSESLSFVARHVVIALGGSPKIPPVLAPLEDKVVHSSQYLKVFPRDAPIDKSLHIAIIGAGQSAAEIYEDLTSRLPEATIRLFFADNALRPSDDSPFVNEIFDPSRAAEFYALPPESRQATLDRNKATNYSVVREELLNHLYEKQYQRKIHEPNEQFWNHRICGSRQLREARLEEDGKVGLEFHDPQTGERIVESGWDRVVAGTGYLRNAHERLLRPAKALIESAEDGSVIASKNYRVPMKPGTVEHNSGVWLQGCCQESHGLSDTLLSILATRSGELVDSIFGTASPTVNGTNNINVYNKTNGTHSPHRD